MMPQAKSAQTVDEGPTPSPEELLALVEMLQQQGLNMDQVPPDLKTLLDNVRRQQAAKTGAAPPPDASTEEITPEPGFVIKTSEVASGRKVFINVCSSERVAAPGGWDNGVMPDEVAAALDKLQSGEGGAAAMNPGEVEALRFPLSCGPPRPDVDRKGGPCTAVDVVFNSDVVRAAAAARKLKAMLIEVSTGWVANKLGVELDPRYKLPKMRYKGEVVEPQRIRADDKRKKLVTELRDVDEEPSFALRTTKPAAPTPPQQQEQRQATAGPGPGSSSSSSSGAAGKGPATAAGKAGSGPAVKAAGAGGGGAAAAAGAPGGPAYQVEYEGRPVEWIRVTVDAPSRGAGGGSATAASAAQDVAVEVCGRTLFVRWPGQPELQVPLLFAAGGTDGGATATCQPGGQLVVRLPYRSLDEHLADARAQAPLAFGQLSFASKALLELEP